MNDSAAGEYSRFPRQRAINQAAIIIKQAPYHFQLDTESLFISRDMRSHSVMFKVRSRLAKFHENKIIRQTRYTHATPHGLPFRGKKIKNKKPCIIVPRIAAGKLSNNRQPHTIHRTSGYKKKRKKSERYSNIQRDGCVYRNIRGVTRA